ncbi:MAG TPA: 2,3-bisphosphoglycerate-independent phosphoglycerate mutase [bacterium]|nr:2,3-bisphosphoglycerate-independent phosphoglycerate mutase [bacterium]
MFDYIDMMKKLSVKNDGKIVLVVMDGLGGCETEDGGKTELEMAKTPNLDELARGGTLGLSDPIAPGFTPGSGPAHLSLFGYDPVKYNIGRGILAAAGIGFPLESSDVAARGNYCTVDDSGAVTDRRAGRIPTDKNAELCAILDGIEVNGVRAYVRAVKEHRCVIIFRGEGLHGDLTDSDPQVTGKKPIPISANSAASEKMAGIANAFLAEAFKRLAGSHPANGLLLRGFDAVPHLPQMPEVTKLTPAAVAVYPDYKGISRLVGMKVIEVGGESIKEEIDALAANWANHDFFYLHVKKTDSSGEDGNFAKKVSVIEEFDSLLPGIMSLKPDVVAVTGDHSTPALLKAHSWHPVPLLLNSQFCRRDASKEFSERACSQGGLGRIPAVSLMPLMLANSLKLLKFGA